MAKEADLRGHEHSDPNNPPSPTTSHLQGLVNSLVSNYHTASRDVPKHVFSTILQGRDLAGRDLETYESWLDEAHSYFREASNKDLTLTYASEWILDNFYVIRQALRQIREDLPSGYYQQLPKLAGDPYNGLPRIYAIARDILSHQNFLLNPMDLETILIQLQDRVHLAMGELWALPIFLRYSCIETLAHELAAIIQPKDPPSLPISPQQLLLSGDMERNKEPATDNHIVANIVLSLRTLSEQNWSDFFENVSRLEQILRQDPSGIYPLMDFKTRDLYRREIEKLAFATHREEAELAGITLEMARSNHITLPRSTTISARPGQGERSAAGTRDHVGEYLLGESRIELEKQIGYHPDLKTTLKRWIFRHSSIFYFWLLITIALLATFVLVRVMNLPLILVSATAIQKIILAIIGIALPIPVLTAAASLTNWIVTLSIRPSILPKLQFKDEIPDRYRTMIVVPALLTNREEVDHLISQIEMHYLRNPEAGLLFALLTDYADSDSETQPDDEELLDLAVSSINALNEKYKHRLQSGTPTGAQRTFYLLHRKRLWNPSEGKWMGWERKRGKLHEMNMLLRSSPRSSTTLSFSKVTRDMGGLDALQHVRFVITLDADTILPRGAARRLIGALAHPLNQARFNDTTGQVTSGYTVLQPRMEIHPRSITASWFTRIFAGDTGLDLYTRSVSDAYQDLFGEGSYVGKGIYDVDAFERSVDKHIPENSVLSHDLLEGLMGRAGLVTDITMIEDYPINYPVQIMRQRRWIRGDWQLLPWLLNAGKFGVTFSVIDRWKIIDNLLRSMLMPSLAVIFSAGVLFLPAQAGFWLGITLTALGIPIITSTVISMIRAAQGANPGAAFRSIGPNILRWALAIVFLPYEAYVNLDAILTTLYRLVISHRYLLQWTTAAQTAKLFGLRAHRNAVWLKMCITTFFSLALAAGIQILYHPTGTGVAPALIISSPVLLLWLCAPLVARRISQPIRVLKTPLSNEQETLLRQVIRRTWSFFERFIGPEDHWLPPDHFQESPVGITAHQTSPTNIGLLLTSTLAAYDFGYLNQLGLVTRLSTTMDSLGQLQRFRGHFLNWYDTLSLKPLTPRYISTVDSGNLAACLIVTAQACQTIPDDPVFHWDLWQGYLDTLSNLSNTLTGMAEDEFAQQVEDIKLEIASIRARILAARNETQQWYALFCELSGPFWQNLSGQLMALVNVGRPAFDLASLRQLQEVTDQVESLHLAVQRTLSEVIPWIPLMENPPALLLLEPYAKEFIALRDSLPYNPSLRKIRTYSTDGSTHIDVLSDLLKNNQDLSLPEPKHEAVRWLDSLAQGLTQASINANLLLVGFAQISSRAEQFVNEMDFQFLFHPQRRVFHIGYNLEANQLDSNFYDLLASEARIASFIAIAKGDVPQSHWLHLSRPLTQVDGAYVLLSWSATMFEYLMPHLFLHSYPGTLLADSTQGSVLRQIAYGKEKNVPWGISESGFYRFDANQNYQYRAFGVPGLGFKRGLGDDLVIAPYASLIAIGYNAQAVLHNLTELIRFDMLGLYGFYESIDFTSDRLLLDQPSAVVHEYMAHHQGMIMMAMANYFHDEIMVRRMHSDPRIQSVDLLLQEQIPTAAPLQDPYSEDVKGVRRLASAPVEIIPWKVPVQTSIPQINLLSNGNYNVVISNMGGGYSSWRDISLTRWQPDGVLDSWGAWIYIQELHKNMPVADRLWSAGHQPIPGNPANIQVTYFAHKAVFRRSQNGITSTMEVTVAPDDPVEIRRIHLYNTSGNTRTLRLTSYGEVILAPQSADMRHPAFNKLFIESEFVPELNLQIFRRRPRANDETSFLMGHMLVTEDSQATAGHEADRNRFVGRNQTLRNPTALSSSQYLNGTPAATLDPIFSLGQKVELAPHEGADLAFLTLAGESREEILELAERFRNWILIDRSFQQANIAAQAWLGKQEISTKTFQDILQILSALVYPSRALRALPETIAANRLGQSGLWRFGISGDYPILLVELDNLTQVDLVSEVLQTHKYLRDRRFMVDVVILNRQPTNYGAELNGMLYRLVSKLDSEGWLNQRSGIFILYRDQLTPKEQILLETAARVLLRGENGALGSQMPGYSIPVHHLPALTPTRLPEEKVATNKPSIALPLEVRDGLKFHNGFGGFSADGCEYIIDLPPGRSTPAPWVNVIGYPEFGFMVSEAGSQCTWAMNSGENRLTPWSNDPVSDPTGEALYLRDEETGEVWTPTPLPSGANKPYRTTHGAGYTIFEHNSHGLRHSLTLFASPEDPVKIIHLKIENTLPHPRRITATQYIEWVLGTSRAENMPYLIPEYDSNLECLLMSNPYNPEFSERTAFLIASKEIHGLTADRIEFIGRGGSMASPIALSRLGLEARISPGEDPCAVLQLHLDLAVGGAEEIYFVLGQGKDKAHALSLAEKYHNPAFVSAAFERTHVFWDHILDAVQVHTPEPATDLILNRWMLYQALSCRIWGRTGFYQSSGAFGFRDQLQDVLALLHADPSITRGQILNAARHQFLEGDVLHWWHPPSGRGVRTRFSDDLLWLPYVTALYVETTGDTGILDEKIAFRQAPPLRQGEIERYGEYPPSELSGSLMEHCLRAIETGSTSGPHGLPLIGTGDWNDGLNRVGEEGQGESVWLAWFLCDTLKRFSWVCELTGDTKTAQKFFHRAQKYAASVEQSAWDGAWYRRAYYDNGAPLGSIQNAECHIDAIAQSWAVLSRSADEQRSRTAMQSALNYLVRPQDRLVQLFTPPFDKSPSDPGYIKGYFPGTRENGGQYTHAATWTAWAMASLGDGAQAGALFDLLNPIHQADSPEKAAVYRVEPYVICADVYSAPPFVRRGGWTWYTGSAAWMYRLGVEAILGLRKIGNTLNIHPVIPPNWDGFEIHYQFGESVYHIRVDNPEHVAQKVKHTLLDGQPLNEPSIPLVDDRAKHRVIVTLGN